MRIRDVTPFLLRGDQIYGAHAGDAEATDQGDYLLLVRVRTDEGIEGWADVETLGPVAVDVINGRSMGAMGFKTLAEIVVGEDPLAIEDRWQEMYLASAYYGRRGVVMQCISTIDNCLWSIASQAAGMPLSQFLGGAHRDRLPAYASTLFRATPDANATAAAWYLDQGFTAMKFGWGGFGIDPNRDRDCLVAIRDTVGGKATVMIDPGWYVEVEGRPRLRSADQTMAMLAMLTEFEPYWVEDFVHPDQLSDLRTFKNAFPELRFAAGEQQATMWEYNSLLSTGALDVVQPDLSRCGGLSTAVALATQAHADGLEVVTHSWLTDLLHGYSLHYLSALPEATWVEFNVAQSSLSAGATRGRLSLIDGCVAVPQGVGIGVEPDLDFIRAHDVVANP